MHFHPLPKHQFELLLAAFGGPHDLARPKEIQDCEMLHLRSYEDISADEHLECDRGFRPQRLLFAFSTDRPPTNIASAESLRPFYAIHRPICSPLRFSNIAAERSNR